MDLERIDKDIFIFSRISVEIDFRKFLLDQILLKPKKKLSGTKFYIMRELHFYVEYAFKWDICRSHVPKLKIN